MPKPSREVSLGVGLATAAIVTQIYGGNLPSLAEARITDAHNPDLAASERAATVTSALFVGAVAFISADPTALVLGGGTILFLSWMHKHANVVNPGAIGSAVMPQSRQPQVDAEAPNGYVPL